MAFEGKTVIVAEDNDQIRAQLVRQFQELGLTVIAEAANGLQLLERIELQPPDLVSVDVVMPQMNGIEAIQKIRERWPRLPCVVVSVLAGEPKFVNAYESLTPRGAFLQKPVDPGRLLRACNAAMGIADLADASDNAPAEVTEHTRPVFESIDGERDFDRDEHPAADAAEEEPFIPAPPIDKAHG